MQNMVNVKKKTVKRSYPRKRQTKNKGAKKSNTSQFYDPPLVEYDDSVATITEINENRDQTDEQTLSNAEGGPSRKNPETVEILEAPSVPNAGSGHSTPESVPIAGSGSSNAGSGEKQKGRSEMDRKAKKKVVIQVLLAQRAEKKNFLNVGYAKEKFKTR